MVRTALVTAAAKAGQALRQLAVNQPAQAVAPVAAPQSSRVTRYTDIDCPRRVFVKSTRFLVGVRLTVSKTSDDAEEFEAERDKPVKVSLQAFGCEPLEKPEGVLA